MASGSARRPPASLLRLAEQAPATVESTLMQLVLGSSDVEVAVGFCNPGAKERSGGRVRHLCLVTERAPRPDSNRRSLAVKARSKVREPNRRDAVAKSCSPGPGPKGSLPWAHANASKSVVGL
jgi:hypothetical protein